MFKISMSTSDLDQIVLECIARLEPLCAGRVAAGLIQQQVARPRPTVNRALARLVGSGELIRLGAGRSITYSIVRAESYQSTQKKVHAKRLKQNTQNSDPALSGHSPTGFLWSKPARKVVAMLSAPMGARKPIAYQRAFVEGYTPNSSTILPNALAVELFNAGRSKDQLPAGTYARKVLEQLLIDLSWSSSRLEGCRKSLLDTRELFEKGRSELGDRDSVMLLNHKEAIEFLVDAVPTEGMTVPVVRNLQSILMRDLLDDQSDLGGIRKKIANIQDTVYLPSEDPHLLEEMLSMVVNKACEVRNPVESAFFLWVNIAYLQPFVDGNKHTSRLAANMPFLLSNCAPLSFLDVGQPEYALAMLAVYERCDVTLAAELFAWTYRRSIERYQVVVESMGGPHPLRVRYREQLGEAIRNIVFFGLTLRQTVTQLTVSENDRAVFIGMLEEELDALQPYNCARYRLPMVKTADWIKQGRAR